MAVHDISQVGFTLDGETASSANEGDFLAIDEKPLITTEPAMGGRSSVSRAQVTDRQATLTCGKYSEWHRIMGNKLRFQEATLDSGAPFEGFIGSYINPQSGDRVYGLVLISGEPAVAESASQAVVSWPMTWRETVSDYGSAIPVGGA